MAGQAKGDTRRSEFFSRTRHRHNDDQHQSAGSGNLRERKQHAMTSGVPTAVGCASNSECNRSEQLIHVRLTAEHEQTAQWASDTTRSGWLRGSWHTMVQAARRMVQAARRARTDQLVARCCSRVMVRWRVGVP
jgi:hypothetical protein